MENKQLTPEKYRDDESFKNQKLAAFLFYLTAMIILPIFVYQFVLVFTTDTTLALGYTNFSVYLLMAIVFLIVLWKYYLKEARAFKQKFFHYAAYAAMLWSIGFVLNIILSLILTEYGIEGKVENQELIEETMRAAAFLIIPMTILFAPLVEETIFRGIIFTFFEKLNLPLKLNVILAFFISTGLFSVIHFTGELSGDPKNLLLGLPYVFLGFIICLVYYLTKNIFAAMLAHLIQNLVSVMMLLLLFLIETTTDTEVLTPIIDYLMHFLHIK